MSFWNAFEIPSARSIGTLFKSTHRLAGSSDSHSTKPCVVI